MRFLEQATFGAAPDAVRHIQEDLCGSFDNWLDEQFEMPISNYPDVCCDGSRADTICYQDLPCGAEAFYALPTTPPQNCPGNSECRRDNYTMWKLQQIFYRNALGAPDQLRQRVFFALNQILVTSAQDGMINYADYMTNYLRMLERNAFGNFRQILMDLSLDPTMGRYLDNITNTRTQPNENYAREIMQLFSIGLVELTERGTPTTDPATPTYDQRTIEDLTKALSGWVLDAPLARNTQTNQNVQNYRDPLVATMASRHDTTQKVLFPDTPHERVIPAGQSAADDLNSAIDILFNHPNVGPFISKALIQMMVTSNPSPEYVARVTRAFNGTDTGVRGEMKAVIRAILTDPEARGDMPGPDFGKLREPVLAVTNLMRNLGYTVPDSTRPPDPVSDLALTLPNGTPTNYLAQSEDVFRAPTVFNFFPPDFPVPGAFDLQGPEFGILSTTTALGRDNLSFRMIDGSVQAQALYRPNFPRIDLSGLMADVDDPSALVEDLNQRLLRGQMSDGLRKAVVNSITSTSGLQRVKEATFLVSSSAEYLVQR